MNGGLIHNKKFNLLAFLSMGLFLLIGFIDIFSWIFIMLPVVVCFYVYDIRHGAVYLTSGERSCFDYILYTVCAVELLCCLTSVYIPNSITATLKILLSIAFYFFIRTFIRFRSQFAFLYKVLSIVAGILSLITLFFFLLHRDRFYSVGFENLTDFRSHYRPFGQLSNNWATMLLCLVPFPIISILESGYRKEQICYICMEILMLVAILVSFSRGAYIALFVFFAMLITFFCIYKRDMLKKALAICLCVWLPTLLCMLPERKSVLITCFMNHTVSQQRSTAGRFVKWKEAINIFGLFPATGVGGGNYALASDTYRQERQGLFTSYATNTYLQVAAEKGIVGVIVYGALVLSLIYIGIHQMKKGELRSIVFFSILLALGVREVTFSSFFQKENMMILCFLIMVSLVQPLEDNYELFK